MISVKSMMAPVWTDQSQALLFLDPFAVHPIKNSSFERANSNHPGQTSSRREGERNIKGHPVHTKKERVEKIGVPAQFPAVARSAGGSGASARASAWCPASPSRCTIASMADLLLGNG
jgi:hypothetical protein